MDTYEPPLMLWNTSQPTEANWPSRSAGNEQPVTVMPCNGYVCVSWWRDKSSPVPPYKGSYEYEHFDTAEEAHNCLKEYEAGEFPNAQARGVFASINGMPVGGKVL